MSKHLESRQWFAVDLYQLRNKFQFSVLELGWEYVLELIIPMAKMAVLQLKYCYLSLVDQNGIVGLELHVLVLTCNDLSPGKGDLTKIHL